MSHNGHSDRRDFGWDFLNSDSSGSYYGSDGSWGYKNEDGSGSYYGSDGSWGYKNEDGSGSYYSADGNASYYETGDNDIETSESLSGALGDILDKGISSLAAAAMAQEREEERRRQERQNKHRIFYRKHWKGIVLSIFGLIIIIVIAFFGWTFKKLTPIGSSSKEFIGSEYEHVVSDLHNAGFTKIKLEAVEDLDIEELSRENTVLQVSILGENEFTATSKFPYDIKIVVKYHTVKLCPVPVTSKDVKGANYEDIVTSFKDARFVDVEAEATYTLIVGWINNDGEIQSVTINGDKQFKQGDMYRPDAEVVIIYHTFKKNKNEDSNK